MNSTYPRELSQGSKAEIRMKRLAGSWYTEDTEYMLATTIINNHTFLSLLRWCLWGRIQVTQEELGSHPALQVGRRKSSKYLSTSVITQSPTRCNDASTLPKGAASFAAIKIKPFFFLLRPEKVRFLYFLNPVSTELRPCTAPQHS